MVCISNKSKLPLDRKIEDTQRNWLTFLYSQNLPTVFFVPDSVPFLAIFLLRTCHCSKNNLISANYNFSGKLFIMLFLRFTGEEILIYLGNCPSSRRLLVLFLVIEFMRVIYDKQNFFTLFGQIWQKKKKKEKQQPKLSVEYKIWQLY